jgi:alpha-glucosidase
MQGEGGYVWWKHGVMCEIWPRSYYDTNRDGSGDLKGITAKLDYLADLGIDGIWLGPINASPMVDSGYDVADYRAIHPVYGSMEDFDELLCEAHNRRIHIIMDLVVNHTSDQHAWFKESRSSRNNSRRDWYIWHDSKGGGPPTNWKALVGGSTWEWDRATRQYFLHSFLKTQPDLNWRNPAVRKEIYDTMRFWLDKGVDGFRCDILNYFLKDDQLRNNPFSLAAGPFNGFQKHLYTRNQPGMYDILKEMRAVLDEYQDRMMVGEVYVAEEGPSMAAAYLGDEGELSHLSFEFSMVFSKWGAHRFSDALMNWYSLIPPKAWPCNVLSNHDRPRAATRYAAREDTVKRMKVLAAMLLTIWGTPFMYYGEEIGMPNSRITRKDVMDTIGKMYWPIVKGRDGERNPMQWNDGPHAGFSEVRPWLPLNDDYSETNVDIQMQQPASMLNFYRRLIALRREKPALHMGSFEKSPSHADVISYCRTYQNKQAYAVLNFSDNRLAHTCTPDVEWTVLLGTHRSAGAEVGRGGFEVFPYEVLILERSK